MRSKIASIICILAVICGPLLAQNDAKRLAFQDAANVFSGTQNDYIFYGALDDPQPPTVTAGETVGGSCSSARTYRLYTSYVNSTGETDLSFQSIEFFPASGSTNLLIVTRPLITKEVYDKIDTWTAWFTSDSDGHSEVYACGSGGARVDTAISSRTETCYCSTSSNATEPSANTTEDRTVMSVETSPSDLGISVGGDVTITEAGATVDGKDLDNVAMQDEANTFTAANVFSAGAFVASGQRFGFDGSAGTNYSLYDADTLCVKFYNGSDLTMEICPGYFRVFCSDDYLENAPGGAMCWSAATGRIITKDSRAVYSQ